MPTLEQINTLGNILNSSWGESSTDTYSCKSQFQGDELHILYSTMVYFAAEKSIGIQMPALVEESNSRIKSLIDNLKKKFNSDAGYTLKLKELSNDDGLELVQASSVNPRRVGLYRRKAVFEIG